MFTEVHSWVLKLNYSIQLYKLQVKSGLASAVKTSQTGIFMKLQQTQLDGFVLLEQYSLGYNNKVTMF